MQLLVNIDVDDLERATAFYVAALGLVVGRRLGTAGVELLGASSPIYLLHKPAGAPATPTGATHRYDRHWTPVHLDLAVDDLPAARDRAVAAGATLESDIASAAWGDLVRLSDPWGHGFCLLRFTAAGYDAIATR